MKLADVQSVVVRVPPGDAVEHLILRVPETRGKDAVKLLESYEHSFSFGIDGSAPMWMSIGFSFAGLEALRVPEDYLRLFRRLTPAFTQGAVRRSVDLADGGASAALNWEEGFAQERAHVLVSWHGELAKVAEEASEFKGAWNVCFGDGSPVAWRFSGERLGHPDGEEGQWVHFGFRDQLSEVCIDPSLSDPSTPDRRDHSPGTLLLGHVNDAGFNVFALTLAPAKVRSFFRDSSFGILRKIEQDVNGFEDQVTKWADEMGQVIEVPSPRDFVKAKLCGRWPDGRLMRPGEVKPGGDLKLDLTADTKGEGCPFGSHVRRMRAAPDGDGHVFERPLQRRSVPFGPETFSQRPNDQKPRGLLAHFFCASIEDQFEHLVSQWAARTPLGFAPGDRALDPFGGARQSDDAALEVPLQGKPTQSLHGFSAWTTAKGMMYAWHPSRDALDTLFKDDFVPKKSDRPWL